MVVNKYAKYKQPAPAPEQEQPKPGKPNKYAKYLQPVPTQTPAAPAAPSLRSETDAIIEEAAAAIPGGYEAFAAKPPNAERMRAMGYVPDPLAPASTGGFSKPRAQPQQVIGPLTGDTSQPNVFTDVMRGLEAPIAGLTGGGLEGWAKTTSRDPVRGAVEAVNFISPVDEAGRAYLGLRDAGAGLIEGDMGKAAQGAQQASIEGSFAALQMLPGSMTARGLTVPKNTLALNVADLERAAVQATRAPPVGKPAPQAAAPQPQPAPFSAPAEPKASGFLRNNADRIVGGSVGAFAGSAGDAFAASGGDGNGGPDIINPVTGAAAGMFLPRAAMRGYRGLRSSANFDERVAARAVRNVLSPAGIKSAEQAAAEFTARFGDKPASVADLAQGGVGLAANLSRLPGATGEAALARGEQLLGGRAGRLERDIGQANPKLNPGAITGDVDRMIALAQEQATPAYNALKQQFPEGSVNSERLAKIEGIGSHIKAVDEYRAATKANEGRTVSDFEYWDLVKRDIDAKEQQLIAAGATMDDIRVRKLEGARVALVKELDDLMPDYAAARQLGGEAPKMREAFKQGQKLLDGNFLADEVSRMVSEVTGQQLTATQAGVIRNMMKKTQNGRTAMAALMSSDARKKMEAVFGKEASDAMQARFAADAAIMTNMQRMSPNVGSVTPQAGLGGGGGVQQAAELAQQAVAFKTNPLAAGLAFLSRSGSYTKAQRDRMGEMLLGGNDPANLARIYGNRPPRNPLNVEPPPTPQGPPVNRLGMRGNPEALGAAGGTAIGMATAPDQNGDGVVDAQERMMGGAGGALTGGIAGRGVRALGGRATSAPASKFRGPSQQTFAGVNAKTADKVALARAQNMEAEGAGRDAIWDETGWFKGVDGKWRFEIDDSGAKLTGAKKGPLGAVIDHPELYNAYPDLSSVQTQIGGRGGAYIPSSKYNDEMIQAGAEDPRSIMLHEAGGHGVQNREGFARGGNPENVLSKDLDAINQRMSAIVRENDALKQKRLSSNTPWVEDAAIAKNERLYEDLMDQRSNDFSPQNEYKAYKRLAGEAEARNVQTRDAMRMRGEKPGRPWETQDVPDDQQIVRFGSGKAESRPKGPPRNKLTPNR